MPFCSLLPITVCWLWNITAVLLALAGTASAADPEGVEYPFLKDRVVSYGLEPQIGGSGFDPVAQPRHDGAVSLRFGKGSHATRGDTRMEQGTNIPTFPFSHLRLWVHGGTTGGQRPKLAAITRDPFSRVASVLPPVEIADYLVGPAGTTIIPDGWVEARIPLAALGVAGIGNLAGFLVPPTQAYDTFYLADIGLVGPAPASAARAVIDFARLRPRPIPASFYGVNVGYWDMYVNYLPTEQGAMNLREAGMRFLRYHPANPSMGWNVSAWDLTVPLNALVPGGYVRYLDLVDAIQGDGVVSLNYLLGSPQQAAAVVAYTNVAADAPPVLLDQIIGEADEVKVLAPGSYEKVRRDWKTVGYWVRLRGESPVPGNPDGLNHLRAGRTRPWRITHWELGNELWMAGTDPKNDPRSVLGARTASPQDISAFGLAMRDAIRRVDPQARLGIHIELTWSDAPSDIAYHIPGTNRSTREHREALFAAMAGVDPATGERDPQRPRWMPDFLISHNYFGSSRRDLHVLQLANNWDFINWRVRERIIRDRLARWYGDDPALQGIELHDNENGLPPSNPGSQQVNLVAGLACAESAAIALQTNFTNISWFGFSGGGGGRSAVDPGTYGWRTFGMYALMIAKKEGSGVGSQDGDFHGAKLPPFYAFKLLQRFAVAGDRIVDGDAISSDHPYVSVFGARRADGCATVLLLNKTPVTAVHLDLSWSGLNYVPATEVATARFGRAEDEEARERWQRRDLTNVDLSAGHIGTRGDGLAADLPPYSMTVIALEPAH